MQTSPLLVLVEGESDAGAVCALATLIDVNLDRCGIEVVPTRGVTNFGRVLAELLRDLPGARSCGLYDLPEERYVRRALVAAGFPVAEREPLERFGFHACVNDLEDELLRALGVDVVLHIVDAQGELDSFRRLQAMPHHRCAPIERQLHRFIGTRATRKIRLARLLVEQLTEAELPSPLARLAATLREAASANAPASEYPSVTPPSWGATLPSNLES